MECPKCNGKRCEPDNSGDLVWRACKMCHGKGIVPDDNENWFCSLPTEEKAKELQLIYISGRTDEFYDKPQKTVRKFIQWLKQPHSEVKND